MAGVIQVNGTRGEITPYLRSRIDLDIYQAGFAVALNWVSLRFGGMTRMPGTIYQGEQKDGATVDARWLPFRFNVDQTYAIEATPLAFRFWNRLGQVMDGGAPYEIVTEYDADDLPYIQTRQIGDVVYIVCRGHPPRTLTRNGETDWVIADYSTLDGPYLPLNETGTTLTPAARGAHVPAMSANNAPAPNVIASEDASADAWKVFDRDAATYYVAAGITGWIEADNSTDDIVDAYWIKIASEDVDDTLRAPVNWQFQGYDGANWVTLDNRSGEAGWTMGETRFYDFVNTTAYEKYRFKWGGTNGSSTSTRIAEMGWHERAENQTAFNLTASAVTGINDDQGFLTSDAGRSIRLRGSDGRWRWAKIVARTNSTTVTVRLYGHALPDLEPIQAWRMSLWGEEPGFPRAIGIHEDRLVLAGYDEDPAGLQASVSADYDNFEVSSPVVDDDAVSVRMSGGELNAINWLADGSDIIVGTEGSIRALGRNENARAFAPGNTRQRTETEVSTSFIQPIKVENMLVILDSYRSRFYEVGYDDTVQGYIARELSSLNEHLVGKGVRSWCYQAAPHKIIWASTDEGTLLAAVYDRTEKVFGVTECSLGDGAMVEELLSLPGNDKDGDHVWMTVRRTVNGSTVRYVERLASFYREGYSAQEYPVYGFAAGVYEGVATNEVTGVHHLANTTVAVWADGRDIGDIPIDGSGILTLPEEFTSETIVFGIRYNSRLETLRLATMGNGPQLGQRANIVSMLVDYYQTTALSAGTLSSVMPIRIEGDQEVDPYAAAVLRTGSFWIGADDSWENNGVCVIETNSMHPATVLSITSFPEGEP